MHDSNDRRIALDNAASQFSQFDVENLSRQILVRVVHKTLCDYRQKLNVGMQDSVTNLLAEFKRTMFEHVLDLANGWKLVNPAPVLFPQGCRFFYRKGNTTIVVIEQEPIVRSLSFDPSILEDQEGPVDGRRSFERISLALPYVVFVAKFEQQMFRELYCAWRNTPLTSLDDLLYQPLLPNIHDGHSVCMGLDWRPRSSDFAEQAQSAISYFWNSSFTSDLSDHWRRKGSLDNRISNGRIWAESSIADSLFILSVPLSSTRTLSSLIDRLCSHDFAPDQNNLKHNMSAMIDSISEDLFEAIFHYLSDMPADVHYPKDVKSLVENQISQMTSKFQDFALLLKQELGRLKDKISQQTPEIIPAGTAWSEYW